MREDCWFRCLVRSIALLSLGLLALGGPLQGQVSPGPCYHCVLFYPPQPPAYWNCNGGNVSGGVSCTVTPTSCTLNGICSIASSSGSAVQLSLSKDQVREIAQVHPRLAASLWQLASAAAIETPTEIHWLSGQVTAKDVDQLLAGGTLPMAPVTGERPAEVVYKVAVERSMDEATAILVISPSTGADFSYFELKLNLEPLASEAVPVQRSTATSWTLY